MNPFSIEVWNDEGKKCTLYTVRFLEEDENITDKFILREEKSTKRDLDSLNVLLHLVVDGIGDRHGAIDDLLNREENAVMALPNKGKVRLGAVDYHYPNFTYRLFVLKISDEILILFSGGVKDAATNQLSSLCPDWRLSNSIAEKILTEIKSGMIIVDHDERQLLTYKNSSDIVVY